jgi:FkbM family methyltransferase
MRYLQFLKPLVKPIVNRLGFDIVRYRGVEPKPEPLTQAPLNVLEFIVAHYLSLNRGFYFVQIGANDGVRWDPLHDLIRKHHLTGLLVEPLPDAFDQLRRNYAMEPQLSFERSAIAPEDGVRSLFRVRSDAPVGDWAHGIASFDRSHLIALLGHRGDRLIKEVKVPTVSVTTLLMKHHVADIALLQIDTEGYDLEVLRMFFAARMFPEIVNFERVHLSLRDQQQSARLLAEHGYRFIDVGIDTLAIRANSRSMS